MHHWTPEELTRIRESAYGQFALEGVRKYFIEGSIDQMRDASTIARIASTQAMYLYLSSIVETFPITRERSDAETTVLNDTWTYYGMYLGYIDLFTTYLDNETNRKYNDMANELEELFMKHLDRLTNEDIDIICEDEFEMFRLTI